MFQKSVINKYLASIDQAQIETAYQAFKSNYSSAKIEQIKRMKEEEYQDGFLRDLFVKSLGYTLKPDENFNLVREFKNQTDGKKADGAILKEGNAIAVIELKSTKTKELKSITEQAFNYKNNQPECKYVITSNFQKLRFYIDHSNEYIEFNLFNIPKEEFKVLYLVLSKESIFADTPTKLKKETIYQEENISKQFYKDYSSFKNKLFENLVKNNQDYDKLTLFKKSQKLIDRFLFILFAEDRGLLPPNLINSIIQRYKMLEELDHKEPLYDTYKQFFGYLNTGNTSKKPNENIPAYNGGLFYPDEILESLIIDDETLITDLQKLSSYDFNTEVDVNILGHIFEHSLSEIEEITAEIEGIITSKAKSKRKKDGVFYTPKYITQYMVENTIGWQCNEKRKVLELTDIEIDNKCYLKSGKLSAKGKNIYLKIENYKSWILSLKIIDPACGSGAFLNQALNYLIEEHEFIIDLETELNKGQISLFNIEKAVLENNLYGVDINEESVEIAKLSLWLRTAQKGRKLSVLSNNIKCGNSLIDDSQVAGEKAFNWQENFPDVFANGGFDIVIGNPPYVDIKALSKDIVDHLFSSYSCVNNRVNLFAAFTERSLDIIKKNGHFSFIIPSSILTQESYKTLREKILSQSAIKNIVRLPNESFGGGAGEVKVDTVILTIQKNTEPNNLTQIIVYEGFDRISEIASHNADKFFKTKQNRWQKDNDFIFRINIDSSIIQILDKCIIQTKPLVDCADFCLGLTPYDKYKGHTPEQIKGKVFHANYKKDKSFEKLLAGNDITRYSVQWNGNQWISYGDWLGAPRDKKFFTKKRILVKQIIDWTDKKIWATQTEQELYNTQNAFNLIAKPEFKTEYLLALLNSKLMTFYHRKTFLDEYKDRFQKILIKDAKQFPIKTISLNEQNYFKKIVKEIIHLKEKYESSKNKLIQYIITSEGLESITRKLTNWPTLNFSLFIKEMNKCQKKSGKTKLPKKDEIEWMDIFEEKKKESETLTNQINSIDKEIDHLVYTTYQLSDDEIKIIENR